MFLGLLLIFIIILLKTFKKLIDYLYRFYAETNSDTKKYDKHWKDIILVMDEAQIYFPARWFADKG